MNSHSKPVRLSLALIILVCLGSSSAIAYAQSAADEENQRVSYYYANVELIAPKGQRLVEHTRSRQLGLNFRNGLRYEQGDGVTQDFAKAVFWYRKGAELGEVDCQFGLAQLLHEGKGTPKDLTEAGLLYEKTAQLGLVLAQYNLGLFYEQGLGREQNHDLARQWYAKAAQRGFAKAQFNLALLLARGNAATSDFEQAYGWFAVLAKNGDEQAQKNKAVMGKQLNPEQLARAEQWASNWHADTSKGAPTKPVQ